VVQEAPQWSTVLRLVSAGLGVSLAPDCVAHLQVPGTRCVPVRSAAVTTIDLAQKAGTLAAPAANFAALAQRYLATDGERADQGRVRPRPRGTS
jgi:DNA-binding transcriptional LysR family regulator